MVFSGDGIAGVGSDVFRVEGKNDVRFRNACLFEFISDAIFRSVSLYPYLAINDVEMDQAVMHTSHAPLPPDRQNEVAVVGFIKNRLMRNGRNGIASLGNRRQNITHDFAVSRQLVHSKITSAVGSKTMRRTLPRWISRWPVSSRKTSL